MVLTSLVHPYIKFCHFHWFSPYVSANVSEAATSRSRSRLGLKTSHLGFVSDKIPNVLVSSRSRRHASRASSRFKRSRAHPCQHDQPSLQWSRLMVSNTVWLLHLCETCMFHFFVHELWYRYPWLAPSNSGTVTHTYVTYQTDLHHLIGLKCQLNLLFTELLVLVKEFLNVVKLFLALFSRHATHLAEVIITHLVYLLQQLCRTHHTNKSSISITDMQQNRTLCNIKVKITQHKSYPWIQC